MNRRSAIFKLTTGALASIFGAKAFAFSKAKSMTPNVVVSMPNQLFTLARKFQALSNGRVFIGKIDTDPTILENQIQVYLENEDGTTVPVSQPLIINQAGYPVYNGQIAKFVTVQGHSMAVYDSYGAQQFYYPNVLKYDPDQFKDKIGVIIKVFNNTREMIADGSLISGQLVKTLGYYDKGDGGGSEYVIQQKSGQYDNDNTIVLSVGEQLEAVPTWDVTGSIAGILPSVAHLDLTKNFNDLASFTSRSGKKVVSIPGDGYYRCDSDLTEYNDCIFIGECKIRSPSGNNYYKRIYPENASTSNETVNNTGGSKLNNFFRALSRREKGGAAPRVVIIGDSLTQGGHHIVDNYWFVRDIERKLYDTFGDVAFFNRGIAGSGIDQVDKAVDTSSPINAPYDQQWNTAPDKLLRDYVADLNPDMIIIAFGMNSPNTGASVQDILNARSNLKQVIPDADLVWITTPIRTTDLKAEYTGVKFGTYPANEYSNNAGLATRYIAQYFNEYCIDVNRMSNITMLGQDPVNFRLNRYYGQWQTDAWKWLDASLFTVMPDDSVTLNLSSGQAVVSSEMFRNIDIEFSLDDISYNGGDLRFVLRKDPNAAGEVIVQITASQINLVAYNGGMKEQATYVVSPAGKKIRFSMIGSEFTLYIDSLKKSPSTGSTRHLFGSMFLSPVTAITTGGCTAKMSGFNVSGCTRYDYKQVIPRMTPLQAFTVKYGDGGNGLNHPSTFGEREMYTQPITEFFCFLSSLRTEKESVIEDISAFFAGAEGKVTASRMGNLVIIDFDSFRLVSHDPNSPVATLPVNIRPVYPSTSLIMKIDSTGTPKLVQVRSDGKAFIAGNVGDGYYSGQMQYLV